MIAADVKMGRNVIIHHPELVNLYGCEIGDNCKIGTFVEIQTGVKIAANCKIQSYVFLPPGVEIEEGVFIGPHACFTNDKTPRALDAIGRPNFFWKMEKTLVKKGASIGAGVVILPGITIGEGAMVGAGAVVVKDVEPYTVVYGNPAKHRGFVLDE